MLYRVHIAWAAFELTTLVVIHTDCINSCKSNYHTIAIMKVNWYKFKYFLQQQLTSLFNEKTMFEQNITYTFWSNFRLWWLNQYCFIPSKSLILVYKYYINRYQMAPMMTHETCCKNSIYHNILYYWNLPISQVPDICIYVHSRRL